MRNEAIAFFGHVSDSWSHIYIWNKCERFFEMTENRRHIHDNHILMVNTKHIFYSRLRVTFPTISNELVD